MHICTWSLHLDNFNISFSRVANLLTFGFQLIGNYVGKKIIVRVRMVGRKVCKKTDSNADPHSCYAIMF